MLNKKIIKPAGKVATEFENTVAQALVDLENNNTELKDLKDLSVCSVKEVDVAESKKAVVIFVPFRQLKNYNKIQQKLTYEVEKKLGGKQVMFIAQRRIIRKPATNNKIKMQKRPISRTIKAVHDAILDDLVFPNTIVGRRLRYRLDGSKLHKIYLDRKEMLSNISKVDSFSAVYHKLTGKEVVFEFTQQTAEN